MPPLPPFGLGVWGDDYRCGYAVAGLHVQEADALGVAAGFADRGRVHADDFAVVADQHDFAGFVDLRDGDDFADTLGGLHVDDAFAAAVGQAVFVGGGALAVAVFGDGEDQVAFDGCVDGFGLGTRALARPGRPRRPSPHFCAALSAPGFVVVAMPTT